LASFSGVEGREGPLIGVAGVNDIDGTMFLVCNDKPRVGFGSSSSTSGKVSGDCGSGEVIVIGMTSRGDECDLRLGGDACGGPTKTFLDGERPRSGLKAEIKSDHQSPKGLHVHK